MVVALRPRAAPTVEGLEGAPPVVAVAEPPFPARAGRPQAAPGRSAKRETRPVATRTAPQPVVGARIVVAAAGAEPMAPRARSKTAPRAPPALQSSACPTTEWRRAGRWALAGRALPTMARAHPILPVEGRPAWPQQEDPTMQPLAHCPRTARPARLALPASAHPMTVAEVALTRQDRARASPMWGPAVRPARQDQVRPRMARVWRGCLRRWRGWGSSTPGRSRWSGGCDGRSR